MAIAVAAVLLLLCCILPGCAREDRSQPARTGQSSTVGSDNKGVSLIPPIDLLESNCQVATHAALVDVEGLEIADSIFADDGTLGYVMERATADLLKIYKGDFSDSQHIQYYNFLEYPAAPVKTRMDSQLVFLNLDSATARYQVIEVGQFQYSESLGAKMEKIDCDD